jgi:hypothetical protein
VARKLRIFLSWSGTKSHSVAELLRDWLPNVIQAVEPWMSASDVEKGERWLEKISAELEDAALGILCLTPENLTSSWLLFEAGALSHRFGSRHVCPFLVGLQPADLTFPLAQFQAARVSKEDVRQLVSTINAALGESALTITQLQDAFEMWWPRLESGLDGIVQSDSNPTTPLRSDRELLEETLELVRSLKMALPVPSAASRFRRPRSSLVTCPNCGERKLRLGDGDPTCAKCSWAEPADVAADAYARAGDSDWKHPKHGPDDELGACEYCDADAVALLQSKDMVGHVQQKIGALWRALELEPGASDAGFSICFSCGEVHYGLPRQKEASW